MTVASLPPISLNHSPEWWQWETKLDHSSNASQPAGEPGQSASMEISGLTGGSFFSLAAGLLVASHRAGRHRNVECQAHHQQQARQAVWVAQLALFKAKAA